MNLYDYFLNFIRSKKMCYSKFYIKTTFLIFLLYKPQIYQNKKMFFKKQTKKPNSKTFFNNPKEKQSKIKVK